MGGAAGSAGQGGAGGVGGAAGSAGQGGAGGAGGDTPAPMGLLAHVPFDGAAGVLHNLPVGAGFAGNWEVQNNAVMQPGYSVAVTTPLTFSTLASSASYASGGLAYQSSGVRLDTSLTGPFSGYVTGAEPGLGLPGTTLWVSGLLRKEAGSGEGLVMVSFHGHGVATLHDGEQSAVAVGYFGMPSNANGKKYWTLRLGKSEFHPTTVEVVEGQAVFFVASIAFNNTSSVSLFINPASLGGVAPATPTITKTTTSPLAIRSVSFLAGNDPGQASFDELRMGTSYESVTPVKR